MGSFLAGMLVACLQLVLRWALTFPLVLVGKLGMVLLWLFWPVWILALALGWLFTSAESAHAGWLTWPWGDQAHTTASIQRLEAANRALQSAAEVVNESSRFQADQNVQVLSAIRALSNERTELAGYLERVSQLLAQDSQWAAALNLAAPVLLAVSVLLVAAVALWLTHRSQPDDAAAVLDVLLVEELTHPAAQETHGHLEIQPAGGTARNPARSPPGNTARRLPYRPIHGSRSHTRPFTGDH
jgi:ABC-type multidrug transport system fused ATPase/permease subunit